MALSLLQRLKDSWAVRSMMVGAVSTVLDLGLGATLLAGGAPTRAAAMAGTLLGATFSYFANKRFSFKDSHLKGQSSALRYALVTLLSSTVHGQLVVWFTGLGLPYVPAKFAADFLVFNLGQLLLLRYVVFPKDRPPPPGP